MRRPVPIARRIAGSLAARLALAVPLAALATTGAAAVPGVAGLAGADVHVQGEESQAVDPAAVVLRVHPGDAPDEEPGLRVGGFLAPGERLEAPAGGRVVLLLHGGEAVTVDDELRVPEAEGETDMLFRLMRALLLGAGEMRRDRSDDEGGATRREPTQEREADASGAASRRRAEPVRPAGGRRVRTLTPELVWRAAEEADAYLIQVWSSDEAVVIREIGPDTAWVLPPEAALSPGTVYTWAITPRPGATPGPRVRFSVASREILDTVARELGALRSRGLDPEADGLLPAAALFRSMALPYDAFALLEELRRHGDPWSGGLEAFERRLRTELDDPGLLPEQAEPETPR